MAEEPLAREVLGSMPQRSTPGDRVARKLGRRAWERAAVCCCSPRLFRRHMLADPWDPASRDRHPIALAEAKPSLGERRLPTPHPPRRSPAPPRPSSAAAWKPRGISDAPISRQPSRPPHAPTAAAKGSAGAATPQQGVQASPPAKTPPGTRTVPPAPENTPTTPGGRFRLRPSGTSSPVSRDLARENVAARQSSTDEATDGSAKDVQCPRPQTLEDLLQ